MKKFTVMISALAISFVSIPFNANAVSISSTESGISAENNSELWEKFLKYDLCITDYNSLTKEEKDLCKFIFNTELNASDTIVCERARRSLEGYDVGRRVTLEDTEVYYDFADFSYLYSYITDTDCYERPYLYSVPDIKHIDYNMNYNEYWLDEFGNKKILSTGECDYGHIMNTYKYIEQDKDRNTMVINIERHDLHFETITDGDFTYVVYPDNTLYVLKANEHLMSYEIPEEVDSMKVVGIKEYAFKNEECYTITLPESIEYIEPFAFAECTLLKSINLPENLKFLGIYSFIDCNYLKNITIDCSNLICKAPVFPHCKAENVFLNFKCIPSAIISSFNNIDNLTFGDDVVKMGTPTTTP